MAHLLVTGGAGYIGSHTLLELRRAGHTAVVLDDLRAGRAELARGAPLVRRDAGDRAAVERVLESHGPFDGILHFAAYLSVPESVRDPMRYYHNNVAASAVLIDAAVRYGVRAFVLSSTAATYGVPEQQPIPESAPSAPINPYGASKAMIERMLADVERAHGLRYAALRYFNACGADPRGESGECHEPETHLVPSILEAAAGLRERLELYGTDYDTPDGTCVRDYIHVTDLGVAHVLAMEALLGGGPGGVYNLGTGQGASNREVIAAVERHLERRVPLVERPRRPGDPPVLVADATRFRRDFGWEPRWSDLDRVVSTAWSWMRRWRRLDRSGDEPQAARADLSAARGGGRPG